MPDLPRFRYHLDPIETEAIIALDKACVCCGKERGFVYSGPVFSTRLMEITDRLCPWCVADGSAAAKFDAEFVPIDGEVSRIPAAAQEELGKRTVSFTGWQEVNWLAHCDDAMAFVAMADATTVRQHPGALPSLREAFKTWDDAQFHEFLGWLSAEGSPTAYVFRCLHCGTHRANADFD